ncbi:MAG: putative inorganic carbon transporter subunit DabA [Thiolinea sp.]
MNTSLGMKLKIRTMVHMAAEAIPFFWPMRTFIHHNPLHSMEHLPFPEAVEQGSQLFHGRGYLDRSTYQDYLAAGKVDRQALDAEIAGFLAGRDALPALNLHRWLQALLTETTQPFKWDSPLLQAADLHAALTQQTSSSDATSTAAAVIDRQRLAANLQQRLLKDRPVYEAADALYGSRIGEQVDHVVIRNCLDFFDEGQSTWGMPGREQGLFQAWRELTLHNIPLMQRGRQVRRILNEADTPESIIHYVMGQLEIPETLWMDYFTRELARLHGWVGFVRWRSSAKRYYWNKKYPADLIDFMAIRLTLGLALLRCGKQQRRPNTRSALAAAIEQQTEEMYLRTELHGGAILPRMAHQVEQALARGKAAEIAAVFQRYVEAKRAHELRRQVDYLQTLARRAGDQDKLAGLSLDELQALLATLGACEQQEGMLWLRAMEAQAMNSLLDNVARGERDTASRRPFAQALFCIDTRSERIRRHLESMGDYHTFGIAGFFGVPVSLMELGKGSETHLCPVIVTPQNVVLEISAHELQDDTTSTVLEKALHELKESVLTPFITVEAVGLLFGFDMIGKTLAPQRYDNWRKHLQTERPRTHLLLDKLSRAQADSVVRAVQRGVIVKAMEKEFGLAPEQITDAITRELRESALGHPSDLSECLQHLKLGEMKLQAFIKRLQTDYRINPSTAQWHLEQLGRIGFTLDEQVNYVSQALHAIGLTENFPALCCWSDMAAPQPIILMNPRWTAAPAVVITA